MGFYGLNDWQWWVNGVWAACLFLVVIWWPGWMIVSRMTQWRRATRAWTANVVGVVTLALVAYLCGSIGIYSLMYGYAGLSVVSLLMMIWRQRERIKKINKTEIVTFIKGEKVFIYLIFLGLVLQLPAVFGSGLRMSDGLHFIFSNYKDGLMHLGFINSLSQEFPPLRPEVNLPLENYHYFADLVLAQLVRWGVVSLNLFFQYFPIWWSVVTTGVIYWVVREACGEKKVAWWVTLVFLLASDGAYWLTFIFPRNNGWQMASLDNGVDQYFNIPYVMAKTICVVVWGLLNHYWCTGKKRVLVLLVALLIPLTLFKVYWSLLFGSSWVIAWLWRVGRRAWQRRNATRKEKIVTKQLWLELAGVLIVAIGSGWLLAKTTTGQAAKMAWVPLLWPKLLISTEHLGWEEWALRQQVYAQSPSWKRETWDNVLLVMVALIYVYGARLAGCWYEKKAWQRLDLANYWMMIIPAVGWTIVGFNVLQGVGNFNSFNFLVIAGVALLIPLGVNMAYWWENKWGKLAVILVLGSFVPRLAWGWSEYLGQTWTRQGAHISNEQLALLTQVRQMTTWEDLLLVNPDNEFNEAVSLYPALAGRRTWVSGQQVLATHDLDFSEREQGAREVIHGTRLPVAWQAARDRQIDWIVLDAWDLEHQRDCAMPIATVEAAWRGEEGVVIEVEKVNK